MYLDGFRVAEILRDEHPDDFGVLTTVPWQWANRSKVSDYRWSSTPIVLDRHGTVTEVRVGNWLRAPLDAAFDDGRSGVRGLPDACSRSPSATTSPCASR